MLSFPFVCLSIFLQQFFVHLYLKNKASCKQLILPRLGVLLIASTGCINAVKSGSYAIVGCAQHNAAHIDNLLDLF